jgi:hypothetical protein
MTIVVARSLAQTQALQIFLKNSFTSVLISLEEADL